ncbi:MAG: aminotransferase class V-fold PLP-dependent enzyme [Anaerolineales bacterium]|nr:aminotransferase class V-fold PLP-dependent enzyme [Anaerolineales bacterium]
MNDVRSFFQIDPDVTFLNHGSFGATPLPVFAVYQAWQRRLERQPVYFFGSFYDDEMRKAREVVAAYVNGNADDLVFVHNATFGVNVVARSLKLQPGDEILTTEHEYGACTNAWDMACRSTGARYVRQPLAWPVQSSAAIVEQFWQGVTPALQWQGTDDPAAYLSAPAAIAFQQEHAWPAVRARCHDLLRDTLARIVELTGMPPVYPTDERFYHQMGIAQLPHQPDLKDLKVRLWERYRIEVPLSQWKDRQHIRISVQGYNTEADLSRLLDALHRELILA